MNKKPISIITINWNNLKGLERTYKSVSQQTARNQFEWIVIDGNSQDGSKEFIENHVQEIEKWISESDKGLYDAMNKGLQMAEGEFVWFMNSGDAIYHEKVVEEILPLLNKGEVIYGDTMFIDQSGTEIGLISKLKPQPYPQRLTFNSFRFGMNICHQSFIAKRNLVPKYNEALRQAADIDWILNILKKNPKSVNSNNILAAFETGGSSYQNEKKAWKERYKVLKNHFGFFPNLMAHFWIFIRRFIFKIGALKAI